MCIECVFEDGVLKPLEPVDLVEGQTYRLFLEEVRGDESPEEKEAGCQRLQFLADEWERNRREKALRM